MPDNDVGPTPLRSLPAALDSGVRIVRDPGSAWLDGSEETLLERMRSGLPLDSLSDELFATATSWPERYHLSPSRANVIRALDLPADATVLEIGAGCGAITRYLGESCAVVDALEPTLARARVAAARTVDLPHVQVFTAEVSDLPQVAAYDVVVVVGVLEYVGAGGRDLEPYLEFLRRLRATLKPGGQLVIAIENPLGVKYLAGAPEDHSGEVFHSVEGYPIDGPARTFNRRQLRAMAETAGFTSAHVLGAFPDYKLTRMVFDGDLLGPAGELAVRVPQFPSPDWVIDRPAIVDEELLWGELVDAGVAADFANSFVLIAQVGDARSELWAPDRRMTYFSMRRRRPFQVVKRVEVRDGQLTVTSSLLGEGEADGLRVLPYSEPWTEGESLVTVARRHPERLDQLIDDWMRLLQDRTASSTEGAPFDVLPHNIHYSDGVPRIIDDEWRDPRQSIEEVVVRGAILLARDLALHQRTTHWGAPSIEALAQRVVDRADVAVRLDDLEDALSREADLQARIGGGPPGSEQHERTRKVVLEQLRDQVRADYGAERRDRPPAWVAEHHAEQDAIEARDLLFETGRQLDAARAQIADLTLRAERAEAQTPRAAAGRALARVRRGAQRFARRR